MVPVLFLQPYPVVDEPTSDRQSDNHDSDETSNEVHHPQPALRQFGLLVFQAHVPFGDFLLLLNSSLVQLVCARGFVAPESLGVGQVLPRQVSVLRRLLGVPLRLAEFVLQITCGLLFSRNLPAEPRLLLGGRILRLVELAFELGLLLHGRSFRRVQFRLQAFFCLRICLLLAGQPAPQHLLFARSCLDVLSQLILQTVLHVQRSSLIILQLLLQSCLGVVCLLRLLNETLSEICLFIFGSLLLLLRRGLLRCQTIL
mmetsp:Transcript_144005/g.365542  ORF Transcript_144005/g.365542 Transcript_144005/m.365542 type:complete len:257 (-) Transcript_144005:968-1738(-)